MAYLQTRAGLVHFFDPDLKAMQNICQPFVSKIWMTQMYYLAISLPGEVALSCREKWRSCREKWRSLPGEVALSCNLSY
jgi:hypothetical protein